MESHHHQDHSHSDLNEISEQSIQNHAPSDLGNAPEPSGSATPQSIQTHAPSDLASLGLKIPDWAKPRPLYTREDIHPAHSLRYDWTGWLSGGQHFPKTTPDAIRRAAAPWESDGLSLGEYRIIDDRAQILFTVRPNVSPRFFCTRVKGRLQHALRTTGAPVRFSRKLSFRSVGDNTSAAVQGYLAKQVRKERFVDPRYEKKMQKFTVLHQDVDLDTPIASNSGRYWYSLHMVLVVAGRRRIIDHGVLAKLRDGAAEIAAQNGCRLKSVSVMPDHLHAALGGNINMSPEDMAVAFLNGLARAAGRFRIWREHYYAGTFSEYGMDLIRRFNQGS